MKKVVDIFTVILLAAAFILAYYTGFVSKNLGEPVLATSTLALISSIGTAVLFAVGGAATAYDRYKRNLMTKSFVALFVVEILALVGMLTIMLFLSIDMFQTDNRIIRLCYVVFAMITVIGYVDAMLYGDSIAEYEDSLESDEEDEEEASDEDVEEESDEDVEVDEDESEDDEEESEEDEETDED